MSQPAFFFAVSNHACTVPSIVQLLEMPTQSGTEPAPPSVERNGNRFRADATPPQTRALQPFREGRKAIQFATAGAAVADHELFAALIAPVRQAWQQHTAKETGVERP
jgi:hypothetical protein